MGTVQSTYKKPSPKPREPTTHQVSYGTILNSQESKAVTYYHFPSMDKALPSQIDLRKSGQGCYPYPAVKEQSLLSNCSSMAVTAAFQCVQRLKLQTDPRGVNSDLVEPSALYNYYFARKLMGTPHFDGGTTIEAALGAMMVGCASEEKWPYNPEMVNIPPSTNAQVDSLNRTVTQTDILAPTLRNLKQCLASGFPFLFTFFVTKQMDQWFRDKNQQVQSGYLLVVNEFSKADIVGAHTVLVVGYDDTYLQIGGFLCRNSWGAAFGDDGHFWFPYSDVTYPSLSGNFQIVREVCASNKPTCVSSVDCQNFYAADVCSHTMYQ